MHLLTSTALDRVVPLCDGLDIHAAVGAILAGEASGDVYVDDPARPRVALLRAKHRFHLAGAADNAAFNAWLVAWFDSYVYPEAKRLGHVEWELFYDGEHWESAIGTMMAALSPIRDLREYYQLERTHHDWRALVPEGMHVRTVDATLLAETRLQRLDELRDEMCSERATVDEFLAHSTGACVIRRDARADDELVAWCLSEYDHDARCEIGIETAAGYRRRGLATVVATALVESLQARETTRVGWHCWRWNVASGATARKVGFRRLAEYPVYFAWFDEAANLAVNGNVRLREGDPDAALAWFRRSLATDAAPAWAFFGAARAAAATGDSDAALGYAAEAVDRGFTHVGTLQGAEELRPLHDTDAWRRLMARLMARIGADGRARGPAG